MEQSCSKISIKIALYYPVNICLCCGYFLLIWFPFTPASGLMARNIAQCCLVYNVYDCWFWNCQVLELLDREQGHSTQESFQNMKAREPTRFKCPYQCPLMCLSIWLLQLKICRLLCSLSYLKSHIHKFQIGLSLNGSILLLQIFLVATIKSAWLPNTWDVKYCHHWAKIHVCYWLKKA